MSKTVNVPQQFEHLFENAEKFVKNYFCQLNMQPENGSIEIDGERYILVRASSMSVHFLEFIKNMYPGMDEETSREASSLVLYEMAKVIGKSDAKNFHQKIKVQDPVDKLSTGPVHFAYTGWANVEILEQSSPSPDDNFLLIYNHPQSFESDAWIKLRGKTNFPTCSMNAGYSAGWCEESFGVTLDAREIMCKAKGDSHDRFVMAPPHRLEERISEYLCSIQHE
jgi:two-component system, cell cycle sensor histidine kinase and response regulator CckA